VFRITRAGDSAVAALNVIGYKPGHSLLHELDPRTKQILVMILSTACFFGGYYFLGLVSLCLILCFIVSRIGAVRTFRQTRYFLFFLCFLFVVRTVTFTERFVPVFTPEQVQSAAVFCWRLLLIVLMGVLLISTTRTADIRAALVWGLRPVPFVNERTAATMVGLIVRLVPLMLVQAGEISDAMRSRCVESRRKPLSRMSRFTIMLFRRAFNRADDLVETMQARCYNEYRAVRILQFARIDMLAFCIAGALVATALFS